MKSLAAFNLLLLAVLFLLGCGSGRREELDINTNLEILNGIDRETKLSIPGYLLESLKETEPRSVYNLSNISNVTGCLPSERTLEEKIQRIDTRFKIDEEYRSDLLTKENKSLPNSIIVSYHPNLTLDLINENRRRIQRDSIPEMSFSDGTKEQVIPEYAVPITLEMISTYPDIELTQSADSMVENKSYIAITRYLSKKYNILPVREVYYLSSNWAVFNLSGSIDKTTLAKEILTENNDFIWMIDPVVAMSPTTYEPRSADPLVDIGTIGTGIYVEDNGPQFWDHTEEYSIFQMNFHQLHSCWFPPMWPNGNFPVTYPHKTGIAAGVFVVDTGVCGDNPGPGSHPDLPTSEDPAFIWPNWNQNEEWPSVWMPVESPNSSTLDFWDIAYGIFLQDPDFPSGWSCTPYEYFNDFAGRNHDYHGTNCCAIISGRGQDYSDPQGTCGMLPYGRVFPFKSYPTIPQSQEFDPNQEYNTELGYHLCEATLRAFSIRQWANAYVASMSWAQDAYYDGPTSPFELMLATIQTDPSFVLVCGTGNEGHKPDQAIVIYEEDPANNLHVHGRWPAAFAVDTDQIISVAAVDWTDDRTPYSNYMVEDTFNPPGYGNFTRAVTVSAYGGYEKLIPLLLPLYESSTGFDPNDGFNGTSAATPHVAALVSMIQAYSPGITATDIRTHLLQTGRYKYWGSSNDLPAHALGLPVPLPYSPAGPGDTVIPIINASNALPWVDLVSPDWNPANPSEMEVFTDDFEVQLKGNLPSGLLSSITNLYRLQLFCTDSNGVTWQITSPQPVPFSIQESPNFDLNIAFDVDNYAGADGVCDIYCALILPNHPTVYTHPSRVIIDRLEWDFQLLQESKWGNMEYGAIGVDEQGRLFAGVSWEYNNNEPEELVLNIFRETAPNSNQFATFNVASSIDAQADYWNDLSLGMYDNKYYLTYFRGSTSPNILAYNQHATIDVNGNVSILEDPASHTEGNFSYARFTRTEGPDSHIFSVVDSLSDSILREQLQFGTWISHQISVFPFNNAYNEDFIVTPLGLRAGYNNPLGVYYSEIDYSTPSVVTSSIPLQFSYNDNSWLGAVLFDGSSNVDTVYSPLVFVSERSTSGITVSDSSIVATAFTVSGETQSVVESCQELPTNYSHKHCHNKRSAASMVRANGEAVLAYISGVSIVNGYAALKLASQTVNGWEIEVVDPYIFPDLFSLGNGELAITERNGQICILYSNEVNQNMRMFTAFEQ